MLKADCHSHPDLMKRPWRAEEYIARAIFLGFDLLAFTDHMSFSLTGDEEYRIPFGKVGEYCTEVEKLKRCYEGKIRLLTGIEIDYHPEYEYEIREVLSCGKFDIVLGSSHLNIKGYGIPFPSMTFKEYATTVLENYLKAAESGFFDMLTHLDIYRLAFSDRETFLMIDDGYEADYFTDVLRAIFSVMEKKNIILEVNAAPLYKKFDGRGPYPEMKILTVSEDYNIRRRYGSDAHYAEHLGVGYDLIEPFLK